jgi:Fe-S-cluster containining protein
MSEPGQVSAAACLRCGACCRVPGYVRLAPGEVVALAAHEGLTVSEFTLRYTRLTRDRAGLSLTEAEDGACIFLDPENSCRVQAAKPRQCEEFPQQWRFTDFETICLAARMRRRQQGAANEEK